MRCSYLLGFVVLLSALPAVGADKGEFPGQKEDGFLLPNGWKLSPAGEQVLLKDLPLNIVPLADNRHALVGTSGYNAHELTLIDLETREIKQTETVRQSWFGLVVAPGEDRLWWSGGGGATLHAFTLTDGKLARADRGDPTAGSGSDDKDTNNFRSGLALDAGRKVLYSLDIDAGELMAVDLGGQQPERKLAVGIRPYDVAIRATGRVSTFPTGQAARYWRSIPRICAWWTRSPSANIPTRLRSAPRTIVSLWPVPTATRSR